MATCLVTVGNISAVNSHSNPYEEPIHILPIIDRVIRNHVNSVGKTYDKIETPTIGALYILLMTLSNVL